MKGFSGLVLLLCLGLQVFSQKKCESYSYYRNAIIDNPTLTRSFQAIEEHTNNFIRSQNGAEQRITAHQIIRIPVVVHVLYHDPGFKIPNNEIYQLIERLNTDFRRRNADTSLTPAAFKSVAADCEIEFKLATSDPNRFATTGIIKKYTPIKEWSGKDYKMMSDAEYGSSPWDTKSYLNIWVCVLRETAGFSTAPGSSPDKDGVVLDFGAFGAIGINTGYEMGRTAVHEVGHWLNLKHLWGDTDCGDDGVSDTPKQQTYTAGCPTGKVSSCNNGSAGNMYMNYMDFTDDACMNMFTQGQKARMHALFAAGGARASMLISKGLNPPLFNSPSIELPDPKWLYVNVYPNPASDRLMINMDYDPRWLGKTLTIINMAGQNVMRVVITSKQMELNISKLQAGTYILSAQKEDGETLKQKFFKK